MWSLGRIIPHPEVTRVYIGSFWEEPYQHDFFENLFTKEQMDLFEDINQLPANNLLQKINNLVRRAKECKALARLISYLQKESDVWVQSAVKQEILIDKLPEIFEEVIIKYNIPKIDLPQIDRFTDVIRNKKLKKLPKFEQKKFTAVDKVLSKDMPEIMKAFLQYQKQISQELEVSPS